MKTLRALALVSSAALVALAPGLALACPVCSGGQTDQVQSAFLSATLFMTGLPLGLIAVFGYALRRRLQRIAALEEADDIRRTARAHSRPVGPGVKTA
jgi:hypothetical protein